MEKPQYAFFEGKIVPISEAKIDIRTNSLQYGTAVFEGIRAYWCGDEKKMFVFRMREHYVRMLDNCKILFIQIPLSIDDLCRITVELLAKENYTEDAYIRPFCYFSSTRISPKLIDMETDIFIYTMPLGDYVDTTRPLKVCVSSWPRVSDGMTPPRGKISGAYVNTAFQKTEAIRNGFDEAIVLTSDGHVAEGSAMNLFHVKNGAVSTPPTTDDILEGVTRDAVITLLEKELHTPVRERKLDRTELYTADELFFCGTGAQIAGIASVDHRTIGDGGFGPVTKKLQHIYMRAVRNKLPGCERWCTEVKT
ncbi:MAG: branched-chain amino acid transaminase [bacterium]